MNSKNFLTEAGMALHEGRGDRPYGFQVIRKGGEKGEEEEEEVNGEETAGPCNYLI